MNNLLIYVVKTELDICLMIIYKSLTNGIDFKFLFQSSIKMLLYPWRTSDIHRCSCAILRSLFRIFCCSSTSRPGAPVATVVLAYGLV